MEMKSLNKDGAFHTVGKVVLPVILEGNTVDIITTVYIIYIMMEAMDCLLALQRLHIEPVCANVFFFL